jgi:hypothetical protein
MGKRDRFLAKLSRTQYPLPQPRAPTASAPSAHAPAPSTSPATSPHVVPTSANQSRNAALDLAIQRYLDKLPELQKAAFRTASQSIDETKLLAEVRKHDNQHAQDSTLRRRAESISKLLRLLDRLMGGVAIGIQANPDLSAIIVGGVRVVIDLAVDFAEFFSKLTDMLCQFEEYLSALAALAEACQDASLVVEALAGAYGDIIEFCEKARAVFIGSDDKKKTWTSFRLFLRLQWTPFETGFGSVATKMRHHVRVLQLAGQAEQLSRSRAAEVKQEMKEREEVLNWVSPHDYEEAHDNIYAKKHAGTGEWLLQTDEFRTWDNSKASTLLWCYGKRKLRLS